MQAKLFLTQLFCYCTFFVLTVPVYANPLGDKLQDVTVVEFSAPYTTITVNHAEKEIELVVNDDTKYSGGMGKIEKDAIYPGAVVDIQYDLINRKRTAQKIIFKDAANKSIKLEGLLEEVQDGYAVIDGYMVVLDDKSELKGKNGDPDCDGMIYVDFKDEYLHVGDYKVDSKGEVQEDGTVLIDKATVSKNDYSEQDKLLREAVENSLDPASLRRIPAKDLQGNPYVSPLPLHGGAIKIGQAQYKLVEDINVQGYVNMVGFQLIPQHEQEKSVERRDKIDFRFYVIENEIPNAFAFPNGMVFIHTGLLKIIENEAQLALVLAHEIAHVTHEHASERMARGETLEILGPILEKLKSKVLDLLGGEVNNDSFKKLTETFEELKPAALVNVFQKQDEEQADRLGMYYMHKAGYNLSEAPKFWKTMMEVNNELPFQNKLVEEAKSFLSSPGFDLEKIDFGELGLLGQETLLNLFLESIYSSHPRTKDRYVSLSKLYYQVYKKAEGSNPKTGAEEYRKAMEAIR